ncbi:MAG: hypothetical protein AAF403_07770 [Pseudomonadota bacterium]
MALKTAETSDAPDHTKAQPQNETEPLHQTIKNDPIIETIFEEKQLPKPQPGQHIDHKNDFAQFDDDASHIKIADQHTTNIGDDLLSDLEKGCLQAESLLKNNHPEQAYDLYSQLQLKYLDDPRLEKGLGQARILLEQKKNFFAVPENLIKKQTSEQTNLSSDIDLKHQYISKKSF